MLYKINFAIVSHEKKYTGEKAKHRKDRQIERQRHIQALQANEVTEELPEVLLPDIFSEIEETYWESLKSVPDPSALVIG